MFVTCEESVWESWLKSHKNAIGLRNKPFPLFEELGRILGNDRATRNEGDSIQDALEEMEDRGRSEQEEEVMLSSAPTRTTGTYSASPSVHVEHSENVEHSPSNAPLNCKTKRVRTETCRNIYII
ncbi:hypothetical protein vseg_006038 [Gypsophila vaccaria]